MNKRKFYVDGLERTKSISIASIVKKNILYSRVRKYMLRLIKVFKLK